MEASSRFIRKSAPGRQHGSDIEIHLLLTDNEANIFNFHIYGRQHTFIV
jgi:hypothetical protein